MNVEVTGARVLIEIPELGGPVLTETIVNMWIVMAVIVGLCIFLTRGMQVHARTKRQIVAEFIVKKVNGMVSENMGAKFAGFGPFIAALMSLSALCSLSSMLGMYAPTSDLSTLLGWALLVFVMITYTKVRTNGVLGYFKGYTEHIVEISGDNINLCLRNGGALGYDKFHAVSGYESSGCSLPFPYRGYYGRSGIDLLRRYDSGRRKQCCR